MTQRTMRPPSFLPLALAALGLLLPTLVEAQAAYTSITRVDVRKTANGPWEEKEPATPVYANAAECAGTFRFKLAPIATTVSVMEAWATSSTTADCSSSQNRSKSATVDPPCWFAGSASGVTGEYSFVLEGARIFDKPDPAGASQCPAAATDEAFTVFFVALASSSENAGTTAPEPLFNVIKPRATFRLFTKKPEPPTNIKGKNGNRALTFSWDRVGSNARTRYRAFFDYGDGGADRCGSGLLDGIRPGTDGGTPAATDAGDGLDAALDGATTPEDAGTGDDSGPLDAGAVADADAGLTDASVAAEAGQADAAATGISTEELGQYPNIIKVIDDIKGTEARWGGVEAAGLPIGARVQVAVATIDPTGNVGPLSERVCVERDNSMDFADLCEQNKDCGLETCSASPGASGGAVAMSTFALALCALLRRRRRSA